MRFWDKFFLGLLMFLYTLGTIALICGVVKYGF